MSELSLKKVDHSSYFFVVLQITTPPLTIHTHKKQFNQEECKLSGNRQFMQIFSLHNKMTTSKYLEKCRKQITCFITRKESLAQVQQYLICNK